MYIKKKAAPKERIHFMTIRELEILSGMKRDNIRFYESKGLIIRRHSISGYYDYSNEDLENLLRIKLLRYLDISLDDISALMGKKKELITVLFSKLPELKLKPACYKHICQELIENKVSYYDLDAKKYLDEFIHSLNQNEITRPAISNDVFPQVFHPWRRNFARILDYSIYHTLWWVFIGLVFHVNLVSRSNLGKILDSIVVLAIMLFLEPLLIHLFKTTIGKAVFGLSIESSDGKKLSYSEAFLRTWGVIYSGMGLNLPIFNLVRLYKSYVLCRDEDLQPWDEYYYYTIKDTKRIRGVVYIFAELILFFVLVLTSNAQKLPPNRGNLTIEEFSDNVNYYYDFYDINLGNEYFDKNGNWATVESDGIVYIDLGLSESPIYTYTTNNGYITGVTMSIEVENNQEWINSYNTQMILAALSFANAQKDVGILSNTTKRLISHIEENEFESFRFIEANIRFQCDIEYTGYKSTGFGLLIPDDNVKENYFRLEFSMEKIIE